MEKVIQISLSGHSQAFRSSQEAYDVLAQYLERARTRLKADPDHAEVIRDLEQSIGEKLSTRLGSEERMLSVDDIRAVLADIGPVDTGSSEPQPAASSSILPKGRGPLVRIKEGQDIFGVCQGLSAYADIQVDWVRTVFFFLALLTGGVFALVYFAMGVWLPVVATREEYFALRNAS